MRISIVGAGFSGAVVGRELAEGGHDITVIDGRDHVAGNCHTTRDEETGVLVHRYGPHLFHTKHAHVFAYLRRFTEVRTSQHRVKATTRSGIYSMPLNLLSMNQFFGTKLDPDGMRALIETKRSTEIDTPVTFEDQALSMMGPDLYREFFSEYTSKQWGRQPTELPASVLKRLPMRFDYNDRYFSDPHEALPVDGYTKAIERMLDHERIEVRLATLVGPADLGGFDHVVWTGPIDAYFDHRFGRLAYRTLDFAWEQERHPFQGCSVMNYCEADVAHTRIAEHNYFEPWAEHERSIIGIETSRECEPGDIPYYPVRLANDHELLQQYVELAGQSSGVTFLGRLGTYRYLDMDATINEALGASAEMLRRLADGRRLDAFHVDPLA